MDEYELGRAYDELYGMTLLEEDGFRLTAEQRELYWQLYEYLRSANWEIPFGVNI